MLCWITLKCFSTFLIFHLIGPVNSTFVKHCYIPSYQNLSVRSRYLKHHLPQETKKTTLKATVKVGLSAKEINIIQRSGMAEWNMLFKYIYKIVCVCLRVDITHKGIYPWECLSFYFYGVTPAGHRSHCGCWGIFWIIAKHILIFFSFRRWSPSDTGRCQRPLGNAV